MCFFFYFFNKLYVFVIKLYFNMVYFILVVWMIEIYLEIVVFVSVLGFELCVLVKVILLFVNLFYCFVFGGNWYLCY